MLVIVIKKVIRFGVVVLKTEKEIRFLLRLYREIAIEWEDSKYVNRNAETRIKMLEWVLE